MMPNDGTLVSPFGHAFVFRYDSVFGRETKFRNHCREEGIIARTVQQTQRRIEIDSRQQRTFDACCFFVERAVLSSFASRRNFSMQTIVRRLSFRMCGKVLLLVAIQTMTDKSASPLSDPLIYVYRYVLALPVSAVLSRKTILSKPGNQILCVIRGSSELPKPYPGTQNSPNYLIITYAS